MAESKKQQIEIAERLQLKMLERWEKLIDSGEISATEIAVVARLLKDSGWQLDPNMLPQGVRDKLTASIDPKQFSDDDEDVIGSIAV